VVAAIAVAGLSVTGVFDAHSWAERKLEKHTTPEKKLEQLRKEVDGLDKDIDKTAGELAKAIVEVKDLTRETTALRAAVESEGKTLASRGQAIKDATGRVAYGNSTLTVDEAKSRLRRDVDTHVKRKRHLENLEKALATREQIRAKLQEQLDAQIAQKEDLRAALDNLEADLKDLQLQQIESKYQNDDSRMAQVKEKIRKMEKDIEVQKQKLQLLPKVHEEPSATTPTRSESVDEILAPVTGKTNDGINKVE